MALKDILLIIIHPQSFWIQNFGIPGEMHLCATILIDGDCNLL